MIPSFGGIKQAATILGKVEKYLSLVFFLQAFGLSKIQTYGNWYIEGARKYVTFWSIRDSPGYSYARRVFK